MASKTDHAIDAVNDPAGKDLPVDAGTQLPGDRDPQHDNGSPSADQMPVLAVLQFAAPISVPRIELTDTLSPATTDDTTSPYFMAPAIKAAAAREANNNLANLQEDKTGSTLPSLTSPTGKAGLGIPQSAVALADLAPVSKASLTAEAFVTETPVQPLAAATTRNVVWLDTSSTQALTADDQALSRTVPSLATTTLLRAQAAIGDAGDAAAATGSLATGLIDGTKQAVRHEAFGAEAETLIATPTGAVSELPPSTPIAQLAPNPSPLGLSSGAVGSSANPTAFDLAAVIDRLVEARQSANVGKAHLTIDHAEFGQVGIRLETTAGAGLARLALSSADPAFSPAVQAALAERGWGERAVNASELAQRQDSSSARGDGSAHNGQAHSQQAHSQQARSNAHSHGGSSRQSPADQSDNARGDERRGDRSAINLSGDDRRGRYA